MVRRLALAQLAAAAFVIAACQEAAAPVGSASLARSGQAPEVAGGQSGLKLHPSGFGENSYAAWKAQEGQPDDRGNANHALYLQKMTETATFAAGVAVVRGLEGLPASDLATLSWEHRDDGHCGAGAPRWNIGLTDDNATSTTVFLGCAAANQNPSTVSGWTIDTWDVPGAITAAITAAGLDPLTARITGLAIVFDEGTDAGVGFVFLDNITVNETTWKSPSDNGN
jgi:hypothetical protein